MKGKLDSHQIELYKIAMLETLCRRHGVTEEYLDKLTDHIREKD